jgi:hypothetical protein
MRLHWELAAIVLAQAFAAGSALAASPPAPAFHGARLGMTIDAWRLLPLPVGAGPDSIPFCTDQAVIGRAPGRPLSAATSSGDVLSCAYVSLFGTALLPHSMAFDDDYVAQDVSYLFVRGRLAEIDLKTSSSASDRVAAWLQRGGAVLVSTQRVQAPSPSGPVARVRQTWRLRDGEATVTNPTAPADQLAVSLRSAAAPPQVALIP